jgi:hypothetical protein
MLSVLLLMSCTPTVESADALSVVAVAPAHGTPNVRLDTNVRVVFSAGLTAVNSDMVGIFDADGAEVVAAILFDEASPTVLTLDPADDLAAGTTYELRLEPLVGSSVGTLDALVTSSFTTSGGSADPQDSAPTDTGDTALGD